MVRQCWQSQGNELLNCFHDSNNPLDFDMFNKKVGHLPMIISRISKFLLDRGAVFQI